MSEFLGSQISLISRSDIRYVGTLHNINSEESTVSLENVRSFGTEGRKHNPEEEVPASDQVYEYIVFRGSDVKDLRIETGPPPKENKPPVPDDPAILGARPRQANVPPGPPGPSGPPGPVPPGPVGAPGHQGPPPPPGAPGFGYYPPHMGGWGRAGAPPNAFGGMPYPPPPGWFPPGQEFPMGHGPGPWNNYPYPPGPSVAPGGAPGQPGRQSANQTPSNQAPGPKPAPIGPAGDKKPSTPNQPQQQPQQHELSADVPKSFGQQPAAGAPSLPTESKPTVEEVKATAASLNNAASAGPASQQKNIPTGPKGNTRPTQILPAVPLPAALTARPTQPAAGSGKPVGELGSGTMSAAQLRDATQQARAAVAVAMANMGQVATQQQATAAAVDNLTKRVNEMNVNAAASASAPRVPLGHSTTGANRGGRARGPRPAKVEVPDSDFDFESSNAKFNKQEIVKEAIAGSPLGEEPAVESAAPEAVADVSGVAQQAYNKSKSFFDNISSEAKDRAENNGQKPGGREWRGEEQRRNIETFGQGSVDGGYRGYRGGRGRGRGGRGRAFRGGRGASNGFPRHDAAPAAQ